MGFVATLTEPVRLEPGTVPGTPAVDGRGICRRYGRRWALVDVNVQLAPGASLVVAGRNGSGKSTLFRVLSSLIRPDRGTLRIHGQDPQAEPEAVRRKVALLSHYSNHYEALTALENLQVAARFLEREASRGALTPILEQVSLLDRADDPVSTFSAGMRKRLTLARTLLQAASVVFLDEPYGQLDPPGFRLVDGVIQSLRARGATVLLSTHQIERGARLCDQGLVLDAGRVVWTGRAADLPGNGFLDPARLAEGA